MSSQKWKFTNALRVVWKVIEKPALAPMIESIESDESVNKVKESSEAAVEPHQYKLLATIHSESLFDSSDGDDSDPGNKQLRNMDW